MQAGPALPLLRQQLGHQPGQKERFLGEITTDDIDPAWVDSTFCEGGVNGVQYGIDPAGKLLARVRRRVGLPLPELHAHPDLIIARCVPGAADHIGIFRAGSSHHLETERLIELSSRPFRGGA
jgi:hypothetical protein